MTILCANLGVISACSDAEIRFLQMARGTSAKTQLCWYWLTEFIIREHLNGSTGKVGPPIISRIIQFLSDGMIFYNHARKIMYVAPLEHLLFFCCQRPSSHYQIAITFLRFQVHTFSVPTCTAVSFIRFDCYPSNCLLDGSIYG